MNLLSMISHALASNFTGVEIHKEQSTDLVRPAFFVREIKTSHNKALGNRYYRESLLVVRYFPQEDNLTDYEALMAIADKLYGVLEYLEYDGDKARGYKMNHCIEDNVLQFFITLRVILKRPESGIKMDRVNVDTGVYNRQRE